MALGIAIAENSFILIHLLFDAKKHKPVRCRNAQLGYDGNEPVIIGTSYNGDRLRPLGRAVFNQGIRKHEKGAKLAPFGSS